MSETSIDRLLAKIQNKFLLVNTVAVRAKQVEEGSLPYIDHFDPSNPIITALREIASDKIGVKILSAPSIKPQELTVEEFKPSALERLAKKTSKAPKKKKEKK